MKRAKLICLSCLLLFLLSACGKTMEQGTWQEDTFTNSWAQIRFSAEGCTSLNAEQMREWTNDAESAAYNDPAQKMKLKEAGLYYDCILLLQQEQCSVQLIYENLSDLPNVTEAEYAQMLIENFDRLTAAQYTYVGEEEASIGGQAYICHTWEVNDSVIQRIYLRRLEKAMICIATSCPEKSTRVIDDFLQSITDPTQKE